MLDSIKREVTRHLLAVQVRSEEEVREAERKAEEAAHALKNVQYQHADFGQALDEEVPPEAAAGGAPIARGMAPAAHPVQPLLRSTPKAGRHAPCPPGSGQKVKHSH